MTSIRFHQAAIVATCALFTFALPANATNTNSAARPAPEATQRSENADQAQNAEARRICVRVQLSNSRIARPVCKTAQEWEAVGGVPESDR